MLRTLRLGLLPVMALGLIACGRAQEPAGTPTISSDDVLMTAEAIAQATRSAATPTPSQTPMPPTATEILESATPAATATPLSAIVKADYNANVRSGPDEIFPAIDVLLQGDQANAVGRYSNPANGIWWSIRRIGSGRDGWIWGGAVTLSGDAGQVPFLESPPTPEIEPTEEPTETSEPSKTPIP
ncbi:MAG TPA: SH3 domain-containing protein [Anaerolineales bacterium]|nr:SH3 domain-containing protein [Anaerolineales bacterium]